MYEWKCVECAAALVCAAMWPGTLVRVTLAIGLGATAIAAVGLRSAPLESRSAFSMLASGDSCKGVLQAVAPARYVSPGQLAASNTMVRRVVDDLVVTTADGRRLAWSSPREGAALVVIFVKQSCPCSVQFEPYFHRLFEAYGKRTRFLAVIDGDSAAALRYAEENSVPYPVVADPDQTVIGRFEAKNGGYAALLDPQGTIVGFWPGFSAGAMTELGHRLSVLASEAERPIATAGLPRKLTSGCPFDVAFDGHEEGVTKN
jgi:hypothetical protein